MTGKSPFEELDSDEVERLYKLEISRVCQGRPMTTTFGNVGLVKSSLLKKLMRTSMPW